MLRYHANAQSYCLAWRAYTHCLSAQEDLTGIRLHSDTSGLTLSVGRPSGVGMVVTTAAGYLTPSLVGLAGLFVLSYALKKSYWKDIH